MTRNAHIAPATRLAHSQPMQPRPQPAAETTANLRSRRASFIAGREPIRLSLIALAGGVKRLEWNGKLDAHHQQRGTGRQA